MELYGERGFENTTVAEIAQRAGLTERTFFRHFADKREVLFAGASSLQDLLVSTVASAPDDAAPIDIVGAAIEAASALLQRRDFSRQRQAIIVASAELQERERIKLAALASAIADALRLRGLRDPAASLAAEAGIAVFRIAFERWVDATNERDFPQLIRESLDQLKALTAGESPVAVSGGSAVSQHATAGPAPMARGRSRKQAEDQRPAAQGQPR